jgi:hypothetical protein
MQDIRPHLADDENLGGEHSPSCGGGCRRDGVLGTEGWSLSCKNKGKSIVSSRGLWEPKESNVGGSER